MEDEIIFEEEFKPQYMSVSKMITYHRCGMQYYWRYIEGLKIPPKGAIVFGQAIHKTLAENSRYKIEKKIDLPIPQLNEQFEKNLIQTIDKYEKAQLEVIYDEGDNKNKILDDGIKCINKYIEDIGKHTQPQIVEAKFEYQYDEVIKVLSVIDNITEDKQIIDYKTSTRKPQDEVAHLDWQLTGYAGIYREVTKEEEKVLRLDYIIRSKYPQAIVYFTTREKPQIEWFFSFMQQTYKMIEQGIFIKCLPGWWCSEKWCGYWSKCKKEGII